LGYKDAHVLCASHGANIDQAACLYTVSVKVCKHRNHVVYCRRGGRAGRRGAGKGGASDDSCAAGLGSDVLVNSAE